MGGLMVPWGWWKIALHVEAEHQRASLTVLQKILTLQLHPYWRFGSDHYNFDANFPVVTTCCLLFCIIEYHSCTHWIPSTESQVEDILHPWRDVRSVGLKESRPKHIQCGCRVLRASCFGVSHLFSPSALSALSSNTMESLLNLSILNNLSVN